MGVIYYWLRNRKVSGYNNGLGGYYKSLRLFADRKLFSANEMLDYKGSSPAWFQIFITREEMESLDLLHYTYNSVLTYWVTVNWEQKKCAKNIWDWICYGIGHICKAKLNTEIQVQIPHLPEVSLYLEFLFIGFNLILIKPQAFSCSVLS